MHAIYGNMDPINIPPMLAYIPAPAGSVMRYILETQKPPTSQEIGQQKMLQFPTQPNNNTQFLRIPLEMIAPGESACMSVCMYVCLSVCNQYKTYIYIYAHKQWLILTSKHH